MLKDVSEEVLYSFQLTVTVWSKTERSAVKNCKSLGYASLRVNPNSLSYPFPLVVRIHVRVRANSGFDRGVGVSGRGR